MKEDSRTKYSLLTTIPVVSKLSVLSFPKKIDDTTNTVIAEGIAHLLDNWLLGLNLYTAERDTVTIPMAPTKIKVISMNTS